MSFYHICGLDDATGIPCKLTVDSTRMVNQTEKEIIDLYDAPTSDLFNGPTAADLVTSSVADEWTFTHLNLPPIFEGSRLSITADYDIDKGAVGLDAIKIRTRQKYTT